MQLCKVCRSGGSVWEGGTSHKMGYNAISSKGVIAQTG